MKIEIKTCLRCGHEWVARKLGTPRICPNRKCHSTAWDKPRPSHAPRPLPARFLFPELHVMDVGQTIVLPFDLERIANGWGDSRPERAVNYERKKYGKQFAVTGSVRGLTVYRKS